MAPISPPGITLPEPTASSYGVYGPNPERQVSTTNPKRKKQTNAAPASRGEKRRVPGKYRKKYNADDEREVFQKLQEHNDSNPKCWPYDPEDKGQLRPLMRSLCLKGRNNPTGLPQSKGGRVSFSTCERHWKFFCKENMAAPANETLTVEDWEPPVMGPACVFLQLGLHLVLAGFIGWRSDQKRPCSEEEAGELATVLYTNSTAYEVQLDETTATVKGKGLPASWKKNGDAPPKAWWHWFYNLPQIRHIVKRKMNSLSEARAQASLPHVIKKWFDECEKELQPEVFTKHILKEYPVIATALETGATVAAVAAGEVIAAMPIDSLRMHSLLAAAGTALLIDSLLHDPMRNAWCVTRPPIPPAAAADMKYELDNQECMKKFKEMACIAPFFDNHRDCTRCQHQTCSDLQIRCVDCLRKQTRSKQLLWDGGYGASLTEQLEYFAEKAADEEAATVQAALIGQTATDLNQHMNSESADDKEKLDNIKAGLAKQEGKVFHELTCRRGKDAEGNTIKCSCAFGRAREMRDELTKKISTAAKAAAATEKAARNAVIATEKAERAEKAATAKDAREAAAAEKEARKVQRAELEDEKLAAMMKKIISISEKKKGAAREKAIDTALKSYANFIRSTC